MFLHKNLIKSVANFSFVFGSLIGLSTQASEQEDHSYLVSLQNVQGIHLCAGTYIGDNQIFYPRDCKSAALQPTLPTLPTGSLDNGDITINGVPVSALDSAAMLESGQGTSHLLSPTQAEPANLEQLQIQPSQSTSTTIFPVLLDGPHQVVFTLADGTQSLPIKVKKIHTHPYTSHKSLLKVMSVPEGVRALPIVTQEALAELVTDTAQVELISLDELGNLSTELSNLYPEESCSPFSNLPGLDLPKDPLLQPLCLSPYPSFCLPSDNSSTGAVIVARLEDGAEVLIGNKNLGCSNSFSAIPQYSNWINLIKANEQGLSIANAYDLGERDVIERPTLKVTLKNQSEEKQFNVSNINLTLDNGFEIINSNCHTLQPGQDCHIRLKANISGAISFKDLLSMQINGKTAGSYLAVKGVSHGFMKGDKGALWKMQGWKKSGFGLFGRKIHTDASLSTSPLLERTRNIVDPKSIHITYRASGESQFGLNVIMGKQEIASNMFLVGLLANTLPGTNDQWVTKTIYVDAPGTYKASISRSIYPINEQNDLDFEISNICFDDCSE